MYLNFGYCGFKELNFLKYLLKLQIKQQGKTFPQENEVVAFFMLCKFSLLAKFNMAAM